MGGLIGRLFREFAVDPEHRHRHVGAVSLTLTPMMASRLLRSEKGLEHGRLYRALERVFDAMRNTYDRALRWVLEHDLFMLGVTVLTVAVTVYLYIEVPKGLLPAARHGTDRRLLRGAARHFPFRL